MFKRYKDKIRKIITGNDTCGIGIRYLFVGIWNTIFGLWFYTLLLIVLGEEHYLLLGILAHIAAVTNAFCGYRFFVFKSKANWLPEYLKCHIVYSGGLLTGMILMFSAVTVLGFNAIIANLILTPVLWLLNFLGHKFFSFRGNFKSHSTNDQDVIRKEQ